VADTALEGKWVGENGCFDFHDLTFSELVFTPHKLGTSILVSEELLEDSGIDLENHISRLFGDFSYFWIAEHGKRNIKRLSERYADLGQVGFFVSQRVDAKLVLPEAVKALEIKAA
jgi:predicted phage gp36 major capsid-like protein